VVPSSLKNPTVKAVIDAFQRGDRTACRLDVGQVE